MVAKTPPHMSGEHVGYCGIWMGCDSVQKIVLGWDGPAMLLFLWICGVAVQRVNEGQFCRIQRIPLPVPVHRDGERGIPSNPYNPYPLPLHLRLTSLFWMFSRLAVWSSGCEGCVCAHPSTPRSSQAETRRDKVETGIKWAGEYQQHSFQQTSGRCSGR